MQGIGIGSVGCHNSSMAGSKREGETCECSAEKFGMFHILESNISGYSVIIFDYSYAARKLTLDNHAHFVKAGLMKPIRLFSAKEQVAEALRNKLIGGHWSGTLPGIYQLSNELGVSRRMVEGAIALLEKQGLLINQGAGRQRVISLPEYSERREMRVKILLYEDEDRHIERFLLLQSSLNQAGFTTAFADKTLLDMDMKVRQVAKFVEKTEADAWIVVAGSTDVLAWFSKQHRPAFAWFGRIASGSIKLASTFPVKTPAMKEIINQLVELGHSRIVMLVREERLKPSPGALERNFLSELQHHGIAASSYNLPVWKNNLESFRSCLDSLYCVTPPTALILSEPVLFWSALQHLALQGIQSPRDISLACLDPDPTFAWARPEVTHIYWDTKPMIRQILRWAEQVRRGNDCRQVTKIKAKLHRGGTMGKRLDPGTTIRSLKLP